MVKIKRQDRQGAVATAVTPRTTAGTPVPQYACSMRTRNNVAKRKLHRSVPRGRSTSHMDAHRFGLPRTSTWKALTPLLATMCWNIQDQGHQKMAFNKRNTSSSITARVTNHYRMGANPTDGNDPPHGTVSTRSGYHFRSRPKPDLEPRQNGCPFRIYSSSSSSSRHKRCWSVLLSNDAQ